MPLNAKQISFLTIYLGARPHKKGPLATRSAEQEAYDNAEVAALRFQRRRDKVLVALEPLENLSNEPGAVKISTKLRTDVTTAEGKLPKVPSGHALDDKLKAEFDQAYGDLDTVKLKAKTAAKQVVECRTKRAEAKLALEALVTEVGNLQLKQPAKEAELVKPVQDPFDQAQADANNEKFTDAIQKLGTIATLQKQQLKVVQTFGEKKRAYDAALPRAKELQTRLEQQGQGLSNKDALVKPVKDVIDAAEQKGGTLKFDEAVAELSQVDQKFKEQTRAIEQARGQELQTAAAGDPDYTDAQAVQDKFKVWKDGTQKLLDPLRQAGPGAAKLVTAFDKQIDDAEQPLVTALKKTDQKPIRKAFEQGVADLEKVRKEIQKTAPQVSLYVSELKRAEALQAALKTEVDHVVTHVPQKDQFLKPLDDILAAAKKVADDGQFEKASKTLAPVAGKQGELMTAVHGYAEQETAYDATRKTAEVTLKKLKLECAALDDKAATAQCKPLVDLLANAQKEANDGKFAAASKILEGAAKIYSAQSKGVEPLHQKQLAAAGEKPLYLDRAKQVQKTLDELKEVPGTKAQRDLLQTMLTDADNLVKGKEDTEANYAEALKQFKDHDKTAAEARKASEKFSNQAGVKPFEDARAKLVGELDAFEQALGLLHPDWIANARKAIDDGVKVLADDANAGKLAQTVPPLVQNLSQQTDKLKNEREAQVKAKGGCESLIEGLRQQVYGQFKDEAPRAQYQELSADFEGAETLYGAHRYDTAEVQFKDLDIKLKSKPFADLLTARETWMTEAKKFQDDKVLAETAETFGDVAKLAKDLQRRFAMLEARTNKTRDFTNSLVDLQKLNQEVADLKNTVAGAGGAGKASERKKKIEDLDKALAKADTVLATAKQALDDKLEELGDADGNPAFFNKKIKKILKDDIPAARRTIFTAADIVTWEADWKKAVEKIDAITAEVQDVLDDKPAGRLDKSKRKAAEIKKTSEDAANKGKFAEVVRRSRALLDELKMEKHKDLQKFTGEVAAIEQKDQADAATWTSLEAKNKELEKATQDGQKDRDKARDKARGDLTKLTAEADRLEKEHKNHKQYAQSVRNQLAECEGLINTGMMCTIEQAQAKLNTLETEIKKSLGDTTEPNSIKRVKERLEQLKAKIDDPALKTALPGKHKVFKKRLEDKFLPKDCKECAPKEAADLLDKFEEEVDTTITRAKANLEARVRIEKLADKLEERLEDDALHVAPKLVAKLKKQVASLRNPGGNQETVAELDLKSIQILLDKFAHPQNGAATLEKQETAAVKEAANDEALAKKWDAVQKLFETNEQAQADAKKKEVEAAKSKIDQDLFESIAYNVKLAQDAAKTGNFEEAMAQLQVARREAQQFVQNPYNRKIAQRKALDKVNTEWKRSVSEYIRGITELEQAIDQSDTDPNKAKATAAKTALGPLIQLFNPNAFDQVLKHFRAKKVPANRRRAAKEAGLRYVRRFRKQLAGHKVLQMVRTNPFGITVDLKDLGTSLRNFELALLRA